MKVQAKVLRIILTVLLLAVASVAWAGSFGGFGPGQGVAPVGGGPTTSTWAEVLVNAALSGGTDVTIDGTDQLFLNNGASGDPAIAWTANPTTGFRQVANNIVVDIAGSQTVTISASGITLANSSVGIAMGGTRILAYRREVEDVTANNTILESESGKTFTNRGDLGTQQADLPPAPTEGVWYVFSVTDAQQVEINPGTNDHLIYSGGAMVDGEILRSSTVGSTLWVTALSDGNWLAVDTGTWVEETP